MILIYGSDYQGSIPLVKVILFVSFLSCITAPVSAVALSKNKPNIMFYLNLFSLSVKIPILYVLSHYFGLMGIVYGYVLNTALETVMILNIVNRLVGSFMTVFLKNILKPIIFSLIMVFAIALYQTLIGTVGIYNLLIQISIGAFIYIFLTFRFKISIREIMDLRKTL